MKKGLLVLLVSLISLFQVSQAQINLSALPLYSGNADSALVPSLVSGVAKKVYGIDLARSKYSKTDTGFASSTNISTIGNRNKLRDSIGALLQAYLSLSGGTLTGNTVLKNGTTGMLQSIYQSYTDANNYSVLQVGNDPYFGQVAIGLDGKTAGTRNGTQLIIYSSGSSGNIAFATGGSNRWQINAGGHFVASTGQDNTYDFGADGAGRARSAYLGTSLFSPLVNGSSSANGSLTLQGTTNATRTTSYLLMQPNGGLVGIGTSSPLAPLHIGNAQLDLTIGSGAGSGIAANLYYSSGWKYIKSSQAGSVIALNTNGVSIGDIGFYTAPSGTANATATLSARMVILEGGNVGIGTTSPGNLLHILAASGNKGITIENTGTGANDNAAIGLTNSTLSASIFTTTAAHATLPSTSGFYTNAANGFTVTDGSNQFFRVMTTNGSTSIKPTFAASSGTTATQSLTISGTINNTGSYAGTHTSLLINPTATSLTGTTLNLIDAQVGGVSKFRVASNGNTYTKGIVSNFSGAGASLYIDDGQYGKNIGMPNLSAMTQGVIGWTAFGDNVQASTTYIGGVDAGALTLVGATGIIASSPYLAGSTSANGSISIQGTSNATRTTSYVALQPTAGFVIVGASSTTSPRTLTVTDPLSNGTPIKVESSTASSYIQFKTSGAATNYIGANGTALSFITADVERWKIDASGHLLAGTDNTYDIGASASGRVRTIYAAGNVQMDGDLYARIANVSNSVRISGSTPFVSYGGTTSSFPMSKRNGAGIDIRLADDSGPSFLNASVFSVSTTTTPSPASGIATFWFDGTNIRVTKNVGGTTTTSTIF